MGRKSVGERESERRGGWRESEVWRYESSAGERVTDEEAAGMITARAIGDMKLRMDRKRKMRFGLS